MAADGTVHYGDVSKRNEIGFIFGVRICSPTPCIISNVFFVRAMPPYVFDNRKVFEFNIMLHYSVSSSYVTTGCVKLLCVYACMTALSIKALRPTPCASGLAVKKG